MDFYIPLKLLNKTMIWKENHIHIKNFSGNNYSIKILMNKVSFYFKEACYLASF